MNLQKCFCIILKNSSYSDQLKKAVNINYNRLAKSLLKLNIECLHAGPLSFDMFPQALVIFDQGDGLVEYDRDNGVGAWRWPGDELPFG